MQYFDWFMQDSGRIIHDFGWVMTDSGCFMQDSDRIMQILVGS